MKYKSYHYSQIEQRLYVQIQLPHLFFNEFKDLTVNCKKIILKKTFNISDFILTQNTCFGHGSNGSVFEVQRIYIEASQNCILKMEEVTTLSRSQQSDYCCRQWDYVIEISGPELFAFYEILQFIQIHLLLKILQYINFNVEVFYCYSFTFIISSQQIFLSYHLSGIYLCKKLLRKLIFYLRRMKMELQWSSLL